MVMVKPGMPYLDIVTPREGGVRHADVRLSGQRRIRHACAAAAQNGWLDRQRTVLESLLAFKRAGADGILTYFAVEAAQMS